MSEVERSSRNERADCDSELLLAVDLALTGAVVELGSLQNRESLVSHLQTHTPKI